MLTLKHRATHWDNQQNETVSSLGLIIKEEGTHHRQLITPKYLKMEITANLRWVKRKNLTSGNGWHQVWILAYKGRLKHLECREDLSLPTSTQKTRLLRFPWGYSNMNLCCAFLLHCEFLSFPSEPLSPQDAFWVGTLALLVCLGHLVDFVLFWLHFSQSPCGPSKQMWLFNCFWQARAWLNQLRKMPKDTL